MITPGVLKPQSTTQNTLPIDSPPPTGNLEGAEAGFFLGERHNLLGDEILRGEKLFDKAFNPGKTITHDEWKNDPELYRPGLDFPKEGGSRNVAKVNAASYDREGYLNDQLANMRSGIIPWTASTAGQLIGSAADPNNLIAGFGAAELMGPGRAIVARALQESTRGAQVAGAAGVGAIQEGAAFTPFALANYDVSNQLGQNPTALSVVANIAVGVGFGAVIHGYVKNKQLITTEAHETALQTATAQAMNGQRVDVADIVKRGYNEARENEGPTITPNAQEEITAKVRDNAKRTEIAEKNLKEAQDKEAFNSKAKGLLEEEKPLPAESDLIEKALKISEKPPATRSADDNLFLKGLPKNEEFQQALAIEKKPGATRTAEENIALRAFHAGEEPMMIKNRLEEQGKQIVDLQKQLSEAKPDSKNAEKLKAQITDLNQRVKDGEERLDELAGHGDESPQLKEARKEFEAAKDEGDRLKSMAQAHNIELHMDETPELPVSPEDVEDTVKKQGTWENDTALNPEDMKAFDNQVEAAPSEEAILDEAEKAIDDLRKAGSLTEEDLHILDELERYEKASDKYEATLKAFRDCITGGRK